MLVIFCNVSYSIANVLSGGLRFRKAVCVSTQAMGSVDYIIVMTFWHIILSYDSTPCHRIRKKCLLFLCLYLTLFEISVQHVPLNENFILLSKTKFKMSFPWVI